MRFVFDGARNLLPTKTSLFSRLSLLLHHILWIWMTLKIRRCQNLQIYPRVLQDPNRLLVQVFGSPIHLHACVVLESLAVRRRRRLELSLSSLLTFCFHNKKTVIRIPHHCRKCGYCVCSKCSPHRIVVVLNEPPQRVCDYCVNGAKDESSNDLVELASKGKSVFSKSLSGDA